MLKLDIKQNALHSLHHAIKLIYSASLEKNINGRFFNDDDHFVEWHESGKRSFSLADYTPLPPKYDLKFALLHLVQTAELILKAYISNVNPNAIFVQKKNIKTEKTINTYDALKFIETHKPNFLSPDEKELLENIRNIRNKIEHYKFEFDESQLKQKCIDFLALCMYLLQNLLSVNVLEIFDYDALRDKPDPISDFLQHILSGASPLGQISLKNTAIFWAENNRYQTPLFCLVCKTRTVSVEKEICMGCGTPSTREISKLLEELDNITSLYLKIKEK